MTGTPWACTGHPNAPEIQTLAGVVLGLDSLKLAQLALITTDPRTTMYPRSVAFGLEVPGVVDLLATCEHLEEISRHAEDLELLPAATSGLVPASLTGHAFTLLADAVAAAYARPVLSPTGYTVLNQPLAQVL